MDVKQIIKPTCILHTAIFVTCRIGFQPELHIHGNGTTTPPTETILFFNKKHKILVGYNYLSQSLNFQCQSVIKTGRHQQFLSLDPYADHIILYSLLSY